MTKNTRNQRGSTHVVIITIIAIAIIGALGYVLWNAFVRTDSQQGTQQTIEAPQTQIDESTNLETFNSEVIGITFTYPKDWVKVECDSEHLENPQNTVYFGANNYGVGIFEGSESILCGGGTDFPPQITISRVDTEYAFMGETAELTIDDKPAKKYVETASEEGILPGLERTSYVVDMGGNEYVVFVYNRFPGKSGDSRDNSDGTLGEFIKLVEKSTRFY